MTEAVFAYEFEEDVPSNKKELLAKLVGATVAELVRYSWWPAAESAKECNIPNGSVFSLTAGPLLLTLQSGLAVSVFSIPQLISVVVTVERDESGRIVDDNPVTGDDELYPVSATDSVYSSDDFGRFVGKRIASIHLLQRAAEEPGWSYRPREVGVVLAFDGGGELILA